MNYFTIRDIEQLTGIKSHTLRIWEQRYGIPSPKRTDTNIRYYDDEDLKLLLNVSLLNRQGHKISHITSLSKDDLLNLVARAAEQSVEPGIQGDALLAAMFNLDEAAFEKILSANLLKSGLQKTLVEIFFPFMKRIGLLWQTGQVSPAFEHFMSNLVRQKIIVAIDSQVSTPKPGSKKFLLFLPEFESHELGLLFANYIIRSSGHQTLYLGANLPYTELDAITGQYHADYILTLLTSTPARVSIQGLISNMGNRYKEHQVLISGIQVTGDIKFTLPENVKILKEIGDLPKLLEKL